ncbi:MULTISPECIES: two-component system sensor histidine kinase CreC [unclassified Janthinobacterium]|uniref:two-component system sensor histidine kinase CreC n=1 Tax=unclassified Janthinobacterium TaxID=2610881 RepID=UPI00089182BE|nr:MULTISPECIES: two-component system sensor histidine kinase CreC [unclassified Janthinobacterium]SDA80267.1 two-component system, OmpR family, sensor histidine kinase CreC [Janthinobacterium sp. 551a]SFB63094.1 two-component system, OmpR family, sensor histidine kinase CreC [Janthinobacterium sp. 344]
MKIGLRILLGYFLIVGLAAWFLLNVFMEQVKPGVRSTLEDTLVDTSQLLASLVAPDMRAGALANSPVVARMQDYARHGVDININGVRKQTLDYRIYITDRRGIVLFDSSGRDVGRDYSRWNDVYLTLQGKYGARSTRSVPDDEMSTVMHVAAPIREGGEVIGVLTVAKPNASVQAFVERSQRKILQRGAVLLLLSLLIGLAFAWWLHHALGKLMRYIGEVEAGRKVALPALGRNEFGTLGRALEAMRIRLEGKEYVEQLMHTLAHELKSPIAAIQASAELLQEDMPPAERRQFLASILEQNARQRQLIDKLLALVRVEKQQRLDHPERIALAPLLAQVAQDAAATLAARGLHLQLDADELAVAGDALLLRQALGNLLDNAAGFAPPGSRIDLTAHRQGAHVEIAVRDRGAGIPAYARERVFERFYSLPRPASGKSTGLGLPFVREVASLHGGTVEVVNHAEGGACARLCLPLA